MGSLETATCEKLNLSLCRHMLGVHKKSQVSVIRGELGRFPLGIDLVDNVAAYKQYLESKEGGTIVSETFQ